MPARGAHGSLAAGRVARLEPRSAGTITIALDGVLIIDLLVHADDRGAFAETFRRSWLPDGVPPMIQANLSISRAGVVRGMHFHRAQADYWVVLQGRAFIALSDMRIGSPSEGDLQTLTLDASEQRRGIYVPAGVAHGFCAVSEVTLQYMVDAYHTGEDEHGFAWDDPELAIPWPTRQPVLSPRDAHAPPFSAVRSKAPRYWSPGKVDVDGLPGAPIAPDAIQP